MATIKATNSGGNLVNIPNCFIIIPTNDKNGNSTLKINLRILPELSDSKGASYQQENVPGRASPIDTYNYSDPRIISMELHFIATNPSDIWTNLTYLRAIQSVVYPVDVDISQLPYGPPPVCQIQCGVLLGEVPLNVVLQNYNIKYDTTVPWDVNTLLPYKFDISTTWKAVYASSNLPGQNRIFKKGY